MPAVESISTVTAALSIIALILREVARLAWAKERDQLTQRLIASKDAELHQLGQQIEFLRELTPPQLREIRQSVEAELTDHLERQKRQLQEKELQVATLKSQSKEQAALAAEIVELRRQLSQAQLVHDKLEQAVKLPPPDRPVDLASLPRANAQDSSFQQAFSLGLAAAKTLIGEPEFRLHEVRSATSGQLDENLLLTLQYEDDIGATHVLRLRLTLQGAEQFAAAMAAIFFKRLPSLVDASFQQFGIQLVYRRTSSRPAQGLL